MYYLNPIILGDNMKYPKLEDFIRPEVMPLIYEEVKTAYRLATESLECSSGTCILIQGPTGSGKRTLANLLYMANLYGLSSYLIENNYKDAHEILPDMGLLPTNNVKFFSNYENNVWDEMASCLKSDVVLDINKCLLDFTFPTKNKTIVGSVVMGGLMTLQTDNDVLEFNKLRLRMNSRFMECGIDKWYPIIVAENWSTQSIISDMLVVLPAPKYLPKDRVDALTSEYMNHEVTSSNNTHTFQLIHLK